MGYSPFWVGACMFALQPAGFAAAPVAGHLSDRMGRKSVMMTSMAMTAVVLVFMAFAGKSLVFVFFVAVLGFFLYAIRPVLQAWLLETTPRNMGGTSIGVLFGAQALGSSIGPLLGRSEEHTSELQSPCNLVCRLLLEKKKKTLVASYNIEKTRRSR